MTRPETILIADDSEINRAVLRNLFEAQYNLLEAENGEQALMLLRQYSESITVVLLDLVMPEKDGYQVLEEMRLNELLYHVPAIVITADDSAGSKVRVFELGASDIIAKPFDPNVVISRVKNIIELGRYRRRLETLVEEQSARFRESNAAVIDMLSSVIEHRNLESGQHIRRIRLFTKILLEDVAVNYQEYGLDERKIGLITDASSMHDIGKIAIPDRILNKPGKLTPEEFDVMKTHTVKGCEILAGLDRLQDREYLEYAYNICRHHHERWDGGGYPDGLKGDSIPICAQVVAIADCYDALTTDRIYKKAIPQSRAFSMILNGECGAFSPRLLECFKNVREPFARLSREYADGLPADVEEGGRPYTEHTLNGITENTLEQSQLKYFALLRYTDSTVMEVDLNTGIYHLVYLADPDFAPLRAGGSFEESIRAFVGTAVHPDDREEALRLLGGYVQELFDEGLTRRDRRYRVLDRETGAYVWCRASLLRLDLDNPRHRRVLLLWQKERTGQIPPETASGMALEQTEYTRVVDRLLGGIQKFRCDRHFTILRANRGLTNLLGYSDREMEQRFQNRYMELVYPADRQKLQGQFRQQRNTGRVLELEYRLVAKDGRIVWVSERCMPAQEAGEEVAYSILLDITRSKQAEEELRLSLERHNIITNQTNDIIFEWDIQKDELFFSSNWEKQYGYPPIQRHVRTEILKASHLHPDDIPVFTGLMDAMTAGVPYKEAEFRIADAEGKYRWRRARATAQYDVDGKPFKAVGVMLDIDSQKRTSAELEDRAMRDALTGLYNRAAAQERVAGHLRDARPEELSVLMLLDVDDFKRINDRYGHMFGDAVLVEMAEKIEGLFRGNDIVARIGGDEFMIFMPNIRREEVAEQRAAEAIRTLQDLFRENMDDLAFSCSIGLAFSKGGTAGFPLLFNQADRALYRAKGAGKNQYARYQEEMEDGPVGVLSGRDMGRRTEIDSDLPEQWSLSELTVRAFDILYSALDREQAVTSILELIGDTFGVSRAYIFENVDGQEACRNTFEWCESGTSPQKDTLQAVPYRQGGQDYRDNFDENGIFYCPDIRKLPDWQRSLLERQGVLSVLQYAIRDGGAFYGFVGFDDCKVRRLWTREQIDALTFVGKLLCVFLLKSRAQEALTDTLSNLRSVLDHQEVFLYVLDPETYTIRYVNQKTKELVPEAEPGRRCYELFYRRDVPCENCVLEGARDAGQCTREIYNPYLGLWLLADASMVDWDRRKACLVSCRNISPYMPPDGGRAPAFIDSPDGGWDG